MRLIESDQFPFEFLSRLAERESWRKEIHRPIYHVHKWWAKRLGSVFRGILLGALLPDECDLRERFYHTHEFSDVVVFDPFMGSGTTIGEAHKLGLTALGRDINPVAVNSVVTALGPLDRRRLSQTFEELSATVGRKIRKLYEAKDSKGRPCEVLYYFWVMQASCPECCGMVDLFSSYIFARNAYPDRKPEVQIVCPKCGDVFCGRKAGQSVECPNCRYEFHPDTAPANVARAACPHCHRSFVVLDAIAQSNSRPDYRLYAKLVLNQDGKKEYLRSTTDDQLAFADASEALDDQLRKNTIVLPDLPLKYGYNTRQAMAYGFGNWRQFFNDRQLLALGWLHAAIQAIGEDSTREALLTLFSGTLEFNNLFASYKGEGTGAVRHMFSHHILKPERTPIEANPWGTRKSSGAFVNLFRTRLLRALDYRKTPTEVTGLNGPSRLCSMPFTGKLAESWPTQETLEPRGIYLSCGDSAQSGLIAKSVDYVVTDPPFFDNVHYSELADFFFAWRQLQPNRDSQLSTRNVNEVQDADAARFAAKLTAVFQECHRVLKDDGLMVFTYHHSREEGWKSLAEAIFGAGFQVVNSHPVKAEMSVATPKSQAKEPIQLDIILVCRKKSGVTAESSLSLQDALSCARSKLLRLAMEGFSLSQNDRKIVLYGQILTAITAVSDLSAVTDQVVRELARPLDLTPTRANKFRQEVLF